MRQAGRYLPEYREIRQGTDGFLHLCYSPDLATEVTLQPIRRYAMDAAILFADILVVPDGLGQKVDFKVGEGPVLERLADPAAVADFDQGRFLDHLAPVYEAVRRIRSELDPETALIGFAGAPWTVATYMVEGGSSKDYARTRDWAIGDPRGFAGLIDLLVEATVSHLSAQVEAGADAVQIFDTWAGVLPASGIRRWCIEPAARIVAGLRARFPDLPIIGFPRGIGVLYAVFVRETGVSGVSIDSSVPVDWAADSLQPHCAVQGNLDPLILVAGGETMRSEASAILERLAPGPFIFNLGHGIVPQTSPEHVAELSDLIRGWRGG